MTALKGVLGASLALLLWGGACEASAQSVAGESSRTAAMVAPTWRAATLPAQKTARVAYRELPTERLLQLQNRNASRQMKPIQIGLTRKLADEGSTTAVAPALQWTALGEGAIARTEVISPDALALRVGLQVKQLHPDVELRFAGSDAPQKVVAMVRAGQAQLLADAQGIYWSPSTDGQSQIIEIYRPAHVIAEQARLNAPQVAHLLANSQNDFKMLEKIGESGSCNIDTACRVNDLGSAYSKVVAAVAHMQFVSTVDGQTGTYICTGTLLNDTVAETQIPYFYSAHHCISTQQEASTLNTFWRYEATGCNSGVATAATQVSGGAALLYSNSTTDALLLRLNNPAPAGAEFLGWDSAAITASSAILGVHHPRGDVKKSSIGQQIPASSTASRNAVGWISGTTEGGSSGSGLFTLHNGDHYRLRGGLYGGTASCSNTGTLTNTGNRDYYSRFDVAFPQIRQWLAPTAGANIGARGAQPMIPGRVNAVSAAAPASAATATPTKSRTVVRQRSALKRTGDR